MKLADLNPFIPKEPAEQALFIGTFKRELFTYRRKPSFWIGLLMAGACFLWVIQRVGTIERAILLPGIFGLALVHDTITSHFTKRLMEERRKQEQRPDEAGPP